MSRAAALATLLILAAAPALSADLRDPCFDRPGRLTPPCIVDAEHVAIEVSAADYSHDHAVDATTDLLGLADTVVRLGVTKHLEAFGEWSPYNRVHVHPRDGSPSFTDHGVGDILFGVKQSLLAPDGKGVSIALQPFATAPTAKDTIGAGAWTEGLIVPVSIALPHDITLGLSPEIDRLPDSDGRGHHAAYTGVIGLSRRFGALTSGVELYVSREDDPGDHTTRATADLFVAYIPPSTPTLQFDGQVYAGLNHATPDVEVLVGVAKRF